MGKQNSSYNKSILVIVPQPPTDVQIVDVTSTSALVTWTAPAANFDSYRLTTISPGSTVVASVDPSQETLELSALIPNTEYTVEVATALGSEFDSQRVSTPVAVSFKTGKHFLTIFGNKSNYQIWLCQKGLYSQDKAHCWFKFTHNLVQAFVVLFE